MPITCALCHEKEFPVVFESHHPVEQQPVIICYECFDKAVTMCPITFRNPDLAIMHYKQNRAVLVGNKCYE